MTRHEQLVGGWLNDLVALTTPPGGLAEAKARVAALTAVLADTFPDSATFTRASLVAIAAEQTFLPTFAELHTRLDAWWRDNRPVMPVRPAEGVDMPGEDRAMVGFWADYRSGAKVLPRGVTLESWLSMCRQPCPAAFAYICRADSVAGEIADRRGWREMRTTTEAEAENLRHRLDQMHAKLRPDSDPPPARPDPSAAFAAKHGRPAGSLSPEALHTTRMANAALRPVAERVAASKPVAPPVWPEQTEVPA